MKLKILNLSTRQVDRRLVQRVLSKHLARLEAKAIIELGVVFLPPRKLQAINKKYRGQDYVPEVLTFGAPVNEILICPEQMSKEGYTLEFLLKHGIKNL